MANQESYILMTPKRKLESENIKVNLENFRFILIAQMIKKMFRLKAITTFKYGGEMKQTAEGKRKIGMIVFLILMAPYLLGFAIKPMHTKLIREMKISRFAGTIHLGTTWHTGLMIKTRRS